VIVSDLEVDSVAVFDLIMEVEDSYDITFPMETVSEMKSVGDLVGTIQTLRQS
jgi:acyl carrier protein